MLKKFATGLIRQGTKQQFTKIAKTQSFSQGQIYKYSTLAQVELNDEVKKLLKPEVLKTIEAKTDFALISKLNFLGTTAAIRLNCASKLQLQALNAKTVFKIVCVELPDPWDYYWLQVQENGNDPEKWRASMLELRNVPILVERCFRTMKINGVYPDANHYNLLIESCAKLGDTYSAHMFHDDVKRCTTEKKDRKNVEAFTHLANVWLNSRDWEIGKIAIAEASKKSAPLSADADEKINKLKSTFDSKSGFEYMTGKSQIKPQYIKDAEEANAENVKVAIAMAVANIQPPLEKLVSPEELLNRKQAPQQAKQ